MGVLKCLIMSLIEETLSMFIMDSKFIDSPLNFEGIEQALELRRFLDSKDHPEADDETQLLLSILRGENVEGESSIIVSSTLRRAIATITLGMWTRVDKTREKIHLLSNLQEISRNIDTQALSGPKEIADLPNKRLAPHCRFGGKDEFKPELVYDVSDNFGNKTRSNYGVKRLRSFSEWAFNRPETTIIVGGHSLWFRSFFQTYLPHSCTHDAKTKKMENSGVVSFTLQRAKYAAPDGSGFLYRVEPSSVKTVYRGFTLK